MILLMKQLFDEKGSVEKLELRETGFIQLQTIKDFQPDLIVGTKSEDSLAVLELAMQAKISYALYQPNLEEIQDSLVRSFDPDYLYCGKFIYPQQQDQEMFELSEHILHEFQKHGNLILTGDYMEVCEQMAFDSIYWGVQVIGI